MASKGIVRSMQQALGQRTRRIATSSRPLAPRARRGGAGGIAQRNFGEFERLMPASLKPSKPAAQEPSLAKVPGAIGRPAYAKTGTPSEWRREIPLLSSAETRRLRGACELARDALELGGQLARAGVTTGEIDARLHAFVVAHGAYPSSLNYMGFPRSVCTSVNNVAAHGIPDARALRSGDIVNIDVTVYKDGFHGDNSATFCVGDVDGPGRALVDDTREALELAIQQCGPNVPFSRIGEAVSSLVVPLGYSVSDQLTGHGVGREFHQNPLILHHWNDEPGVMMPGMAFTIEPVVCQGVADGVMWPDGWTIATQDGGRSAQFEHTLVVTDNGVAVLTK